ncbi:MAG: D-alanyl-D-alanine carboxypeptidase, partial [Thermodesulfobacteriota bacterium]|nr:D-alanyl-D-alanine carboxypeptidase [Thermodesulfobacteriota bacterium]
YGDPLLISEAWQEIADHLIKKIHFFRDLVVDDTYFSERIVIPGRAHSTNPYDAPVGAICANFNTVFFDRDKHGKIISAEPQTPMIPFVRERILSLRQKRGRHTFSRDSLEASQYAGNLLLHFLKERGAECQGKVRSGRVGPQDRLIFTYRSKFTLKQVLEKMMTFSNNFIANQIFLTLGARKYGAPATLQKGVTAVSEYAWKELGLKDIEVVEGSGISRENRISASEMLTVLHRFKPYRHILKKKGAMKYKTGSLRGIRTRVGYLESSTDVSYYFIIFFNSGNTRMDDLLDCLRHALTFPQYSF